ncbi:MAG: CCA tRNA nucleotidyltransferase [Candidatus Moranbacteria bacterium]|nr:CCA tRNA nucleotidyltransferase [Candidatus Moranbacteria bacterium]
MLEKIPLPVKGIMDILEENHYQAFVVGGCVRDVLMGRNPKDWDITTDAEPNEIQNLFPESFYENSFGTVSVKVTPFLDTKNPDREYDIIEITTYRSESDYTDGRHPKEVAFEKELSQDLARRDFTINALAYGRLNGQWELIDLYDGASDLKKKCLRTVGNPEERFSEDALRLMRAVRFVTEFRTPSKDDICQSDWIIEKATLKALKNLSKNITLISWERIRDEFSKILLSSNPAFGIQLLEDTDLLQYIMPELREGIDVTQNLHHIYTVWEHNLRALHTCPSPKLHVRIASLLHDVAKPRTKRGNGYRSTFYNHDHVGAKMTHTILTRLRYPKEIISKATLLVDQHLFYYNVDEVTEASVRRLVKRVGLENMPDLMDVRIGDRLGSGVPKAKPYKLRHLEYMIEKVSKDPLSVKMLAIKGTDLINDLGIKPGPTIGAILDVLLAEVLEDPTKNTPALLLQRSKELEHDSLDELRLLAKERITTEKESADKNIKKKHWVE